MALNKKGQYLFYGVMVSAVAIILLIQLIPTIKTNVDQARTAEYLDCDNASISTERRAACIISGLTLFYWLGAGLAAAGAYIFYKKKRSE